MKIVMIQSVAEARTQNRAGRSFANANVYDLPTEEANDFVARGFAIPFADWETNPKRPYNIRFPQ